jgi:CspA family cold shock protein
MTETILQTAQAMAQAWVRRHTDPNEVAKSLRYLTEHPNGRLFFHYLSTVVQEGRAVVRSGRSLDYYRQIEEVCREHLAPYQEEPEEMAQILGWAVRLMRYYLGAPNLQKPPIPGPEVRQTAPRPTSIPSADRHTGQVKWFNDQKGFGFIQPNDSEQDVFVHISSLAPGVNTLLPGQQVEFEIGPGRKGPQALNVRLVP